MDYALQQALKDAASFLCLKGITSARLDAELILSFLLKEKRSFFYAHGDEKLNSNLAEIFWRLIKRRGEGEPLSYLTGQKEFMGISFHVEAGVLVPRPETEHLVEFVIKWLKRNYSADSDGAEHLQVLDIGTGCGNIAVSLAYYLPAARVTALDIDKHALRIAAMNGQRYHVIDRLEFFYGSFPNLLSGQKRRFNVIVSNPPYIPTDMLLSLPPEVQKEPRTALNGGPDGLHVYREIFKNANKCLTSPGLLALEVGEGQFNEVCFLAHENASWEKTTVIKDYAGIERVCCFTL